MKQLVQIPAAVINMNPRADKSWKLVFETARELSGAEVTVLTDALQGEGWLVFSPNDITVGDIPKQNVEIEGRSQSERLRNVIYVYWKQKGEPGDFETFYRMQTEKLIEFVKSKLEPEDS